MGMSGRQPIFWEGMGALTATTRGQVELDVASKLDECLMATPTEDFRSLTY